MQYTDEVKEDAMLMMSQGTKIAEVSQILNVPASTLYRWRSEAQRPDPKPPQAEVLSEEHLQQLSSELRLYAEGIREEVYSEILGLRAHIQLLQKEVDYLKPAPAKLNPLLPTRSKQLPEFWPPKTQEDSP